MKGSFGLGAALAAGIAALSWTGIASADNVVVSPSQQPAPQPAPAQPVVVQPAPAAAPAPAATSTTSTTSGAVPGPVVVNNGATRSDAESSSTYAGPNRTLLMSGIIVAGVPYLASIGVAASSKHEGDNNLYIPVIGPWLDIGQRGDCDVTKSGCDNETANKFLIGADGVLQALGTLQIIGSFMFPETRSVTTVAKTKWTPELTISPAKMGKGGYGLTAFATF